MSILRGVIVLFALSPSWCAAKPNLILFMADDFGYECVTANGGESYRTPNLDRLAAGGVRFETLLMFIGDNGTHGSVTSRFQGAAYRGGKGGTTRRGTHVPFIANWPSVIKLGRVNRDLVSSADLLPTLCEAAGASVPADSDGVSFLPQLRGDRGTPRQWLYCWYSPRQKADMTVREFAFDHHYKLYRDGRLFDLGADPDEAMPLGAAPLEGDAAPAAKKLQSVLDQFRDARPAELDRQFEQTMKGLPPAKPKKKRR